MTNQIQGEMLFGGWGGTGGDPNTWAYTPWLPVRGDTGTFGIQVLQTSGINLTWNVETRTLQDPTTSDLITTRTTSGVGTDTVTSTVLAKQLYRYRVATPLTANITDWIVFRDLSPSWNVNR